MDELQPGQVISPRSAAVQSVELSAAGTQQPQQTAAPVVPGGQARVPAPPPSQPAHAAPVTPVATVSAPQPSAVPNPSLVDRANPVSPLPEPASQPVTVAPPVDPAVAPHQLPSDIELSWTAAEYLHADRGANWYAVYTLGVVIIAALVFLITRDYVSTGIIFIALLGLIFIMARKPREQTYMLGGGQIAIGNKWYNLHDFKAFSVNDETELTEITLLPLKRFLPPVTIYLDGSSERAVVEYLSHDLPNELHQADAVDRLLKRLHF